MKYSKEQEQIADRVEKLGEQIGRRYEHFNLEQKIAAIEDLNYFEEENEHSNDDVINKIVSKKYMRQKMTSVDQIERDIEIARILDENAAKKEMRKTRLKNNELDEASYEKELLRYQVRLGVVNPRAL